MFGFNITSSGRGAVAAVAGISGMASSMSLILMATTMPARADDVVTASSPAEVHASLEQAIEHQKSRRAAAITGMVIGGVIIAGGGIEADVAEAQNHDEKDQGRATTHNPYVGFAVGLGVGLPILGISSYFFADAQQQINLLRRERVSVSYAPDTHQPVLQISLGF